MVNKRMNFQQLLNLISIIASFLIPRTSHAEDPWKFVVLADWHGGEGFSFDPSLDSSNYKTKVAAFQYVKSNFGGDLVLLPGDTQGGIWYRSTYIKKYYPKLNPAETVLEAGKNCYKTIKAMFSEAGYDTILVSTGDHEYGGNGWDALPSDHTGTFDEYQFAFYSQFNRDPETSEFLFVDPIGSASARPWGTSFYATSYAYRHKNLLVITVDVFRKTNDYIYDRKTGRGGEGVISCTVENEHLVWFENVLSEARKDPTIQHIIVQAHVPIMQPVRKVNCSGQFLDLGINSLFWKTMRKYNVDIYFAGEVHANTVSKDTETNLVQVVSRGNGLNNILTVDVTEDTLTLKSYNEIGSKPKYNNKHVIHGELIIDKSGNTTTIFGSGSLEPLNTWKPMLYYNFEKIHGLGDRQVLAMTTKKTLFPTAKIIRGIVCKEAIWNEGTFNQQYDMQVGGIELVHGAKGSFGAKFDINSRAAIFGVGPHGPGNIISYAIWIKTDRVDDNMIIMHYGRSFSSKQDPCYKDQFTLMLENGVPILYRCTQSKLVPSWKNINLSDSLWHHVIITMPKDNCLLSDVIMYIDGTIVDTFVIGQDDNLFFVTDGRMSIGGFGYSTTQYNSLFSKHMNFIGDIDDVYVWGRTVKLSEVEWLSKREEYQSYLKYEGYRCLFDVSNIVSKKDLPNSASCLKYCDSEPTCRGYQMFRKWKVKPKRNICTLFSDSPKLDMNDEDSRFTCVMKS